jgi:quercetin dioxygenase-like cupin family protein
MQRETEPGPASQPQNFKTGWAKHGELAGFSPLPGVRMDVYGGGRMMLNFVTIEPGATVGWHSHPHEQGGTVIRGEIRLVVGTQDAEPWVMHPGDVYTVAPNVPHSATVGPEGCVVLDIFAPPREDYLAQAMARRDTAEGTYLTGSPPSQS